MAGNTALMGALLAAQKQLPDLQRDKINPHFKSSYLSLEKLMVQVLPVLNAHGLVWVTLPTVLRADGGESRPALEYRLVHAESGEQLAGVMELLLAKNDPQGQGSAITYARRYALMAVLGLVADEDDDSNAATGAPARGRSRTTSRRARSKAATEPPVVPAGITPETRAAIREHFTAQKPAEQQVRLALAAAGVEAEGGTVAAAIKAATEDQAQQLLKLLRDQTSKEDGNDA